MGDLADMVKDTGPRKAIDADWSGRKRAAVIAGSVAVGVAAISVGGWYAWTNRPVALPSTVQDAVAVMESGRYDKLSAERKRQYAMETSRLIGDMPEDQRRELFRDEQTREALRAVRQEMFDDMVYRAARGEEIQLPFGRPPGAGGQRDGQQRPGGEGEARPEPTEEERAQRQAERRERMLAGLKEQFNSGNAQAGSLRGEFFKKRFAERQSQPGGGGRGPGGGGGGGRGG